MTREEQKANAAIEMYPAGTQNSLQFRVGFSTGVEWADEHPKEGLWDKEKVTQWLKENFEHYAYNYGIDEVIAGLTKAMEEIQ